MKVKVNEQSCIGCGLCISICSDVFELEGGKSKIKKDFDPEANKECIKEAAANCPTQAISVED
ncbi:ferredoxin [bacterium]|nr:ferredoxin [bacterium]